MSNRRPIDEVDREQLVVPQYSSRGTEKAAHIPDPESEEPRPVCCQGDRSDRRWRLVTPPKMSISVTGLCRQCDPNPPEQETDEDGVDFQALNNQLQQSNVTSPADVSREVLGD